MTDPDYEMIPHQLLQDLKYDVESLKKKLSEPDAKSNELILEIESLKDSIHDLHLIFQKALEEMKSEGDVTSVIPQLKKQLDMVVSQNETIARGMIAISDKVDNWMQKGPAARSETPVVQMPPMQHRIAPPPMMRGPSRVAPPMQMPSMPGPGDFPPPPPSPGRRKVGLFK